MSTDNKVWIIQHDNGSYFERMVGIGPKFTQNINKAAKFDGEVQACYMTLHHWAFSSTTVREYEGGKDG